MSNVKLKAQYNRVRTSVSLQANSMWTNTIGVEQDPQAGSNSVIEASLRAPSHGGGGRAARRERAQQLIEAAGYQPAVNNFEGLVALARAQGNLSGATRGACKICGGLGHLTKQCKNVVPGGASAQAGAAQTATLIPIAAEKSDYSSSDLTSSSGSDSESSSSSRERAKKRKDKKDKKRKDKKRRKVKSHKHKKSKSRKKLKHEHSN